MLMHVRIPVDHLKSELEVDDYQWIMMIIHTSANSPNIFNSRAQESRYSTRETESNPVVILRQLTNSIALSARDEPYDHRPIFQYSPHELLLKELPSILEDALCYLSITPIEVYMTDEDYFGLDLTNFVGHLTAHRRTMTWEISHPTRWLMNYLLRYLQPQGSKALLLRDSLLIS
jgi:hypothetical protein